MYFRIVDRMCVFVAVLEYLVKQLQTKARSCQNQAKGLQKGEKRAV